MGSGARPRRHHIVPQVILKGFADGRGHVRITSKDGRTTGIQNIRTVSVRRDANTLQTDAGRDFELEILLSKAENQFPDVIASLDLPHRTKDQDRAILGLVAIQFARDPHHRAWIREEVESIRVALAAALRDENPGVTHEEIAEEFEYYGKRDIVQSHVILDAENVAIAGTAFLLQRAFEQIDGLNLAVLRAGAPGFITCDSPVFLFDRYVLADRMDDEALAAPVPPETEITMPITSRHLALVTAKPLSGVLIDVSADVVAIANARTARSAVNEVYCNPGYPMAKLQTDRSEWWWRRAILDTL